MDAKMTAFVYKGERKFDLEKIDRPVPGSDNVIARVLLCSICGTDMRTYKNGSSRISPPRVVGHEIIAEVTHVGSRVAEQKNSPAPGQRILVVPAIGCGKCYSCIRGNTNLCESLETIGFQYDGGFAEYIELPLHMFEMGNVLLLPDNIEAKKVVLCEPAACVLNGQEPLDIIKGDNAVIFGAGFIGCMHAEIALMKGAAKVMMVEFAGIRADQAVEMIPSVEIIHPEKDNVVAEIKERTGGIGAEVLVTACSVGDTHRQALEAAAPRGRISLFGGLPQESNGFIDSNLIHYNELGVFGSHASTVGQNSRILKWILDNELDARKYISRIFPLENISDAFDAIINESLLKAVIKP